MRRALVAFAVAGSLFRCSLLWPYDQLRSPDAGSSTDGGTSGDGGRPSWSGCPDVGWCNLGAATVFQSQCPDKTSTFDYPFNCSYVIEGDSSAVADPVQNLLIIWGGGYQYAGNEVYTLRLDEAPTLERRNAPGPFANCVESLIDGSPAGRTTYEGLAFIPSPSSLFSFGGVPYCEGQSTFASGVAWKLPLDGAAGQTWAPAWTRLNAALPSGAAPDFPLSDYDPVSGSVLLHTADTLYRYRIAADAFDALLDDQAHFAMTLRANPVTGALVLVGARAAEQTGRTDFKVFHPDGDGGYSVHIATSEAEDAGCSALLAVDAPGLAFDPVLGLFVGWPNQGGSVMLLDAESASCRTLNLGAGPPDNPNRRATRGRFRYFPALGVFALVPDANGPAWALRLPDTL